MRAKGYLGSDREHLSGCSATYVFGPVEPCAVPPKELLGASPCQRGAIQRYRSSGSAAVGQVGQGVRQVLWALTVVVLVACSAVGSAGAEEGSEPTPAPAAEGGGDGSGQGGASEANVPRRKVKLPEVRVEDPRGAPDLVVCSQNLKLFGTFESLKQKSPQYKQREHDIKIADLIERFTSVDCDVIAVQEIIGRTQEIAEQGLQEIAKELQRSTNRIFDVRVGPPAEGGMTVGYLVAKDRAAIASALAYARVELPKVSPKEKPRVFTRTPLELQIVVNSRESNQPKTISLVNFHFKSKRGGAADPTGLEWETYRMEMAEALRRIVEQRHKAAFASSESMLLLLGDRNSNFDVASARILEGSLTLASFRTNGGCRLSKRGLPICKAETYLPRRLFSALTTTRSPETLPGTFEYKGEFSWLDDILLPAESLPYVWSSAFSDAKYASGVVYKPKEASDHAMVYVKLNW
jgi:hypothetical protein